MKKLIAALLALTLMLCLAACGEAEPKTQTIYVQTQSVRTIGEAVIRTEYTYGKTGKPVTMKMYFNDKLYQSVTNRTSNGVTYMTITDANGESSTQTTNTVYDEQGRVSILEVNVGSTTVSRTTYTYDDQDRIVKAVGLTADGTVTTTYTYDANGNVVVLQSENTNTGTVTRTEYTYDAENFVTLEKIFDQDGNLQESVVYTYEGKTARTQTTYNADGEPTGEVTRLEYDEHGNLVKEISYVDGEVAQTIVSTYEAMEVPVEEE